MRKRGFIASAWQDYVGTINQFLPASIRSRFFTRKAVYMALIFIGVELILAMAIYMFWIKNS